MTRVGRKLLTEILGVRGRVDVLRGLMRLSDRYSGSARNIARMAGMNHRVAQRALDELVSTGLVHVRLTPGANLFSLNADNMLYEPLKAIFRAEAGYLEEVGHGVRQSLRDHGLPVRKAYLYGSVARGEESPDSDVDVALVIDGSDEDLVRAELDAVAEDLRVRFGTDFHFIVATRPIDQMARRRVSGGLWRSIAAEGVEVS